MSGTGALDHVSRWIAALTGTSRVRREDRARYLAQGGTAGDVRRRMRDGEAAMRVVAASLAHQDEARPPQASDGSAGRDAAPRG